MGDATLVEAQRLHDLGFAIHWIRPRSKIPVEGGWTTGPRKKWGYLEATYRGGFNVGTRLGSPSVLDGRYLAVIDVDVKSDDDRYLRQALGAVERLIDRSNCPVVRSGRGNGSRHYYCSTVRPFKTFTPARSEETVKAFIPSRNPSRRERETLTPEELGKGIRLSPAWEVSLYSDGRQVVLPPSVHPDSGERYRWTRSTDVGFPLFKPVLGASTASNGGSEGPGSPGKPALTDFRATPVELQWLDISDKVRQGILVGKDVADRSAFLMKASTALFSAGLTENEVLSVLTDRETFLGECAFDHAKTDSRRRAAEWVHRYTVGRMSRERKESVSVFLHAPVAPRTLTREEIAKAERAVKTAKPWTQDLDRTKEGATRGTLKNLDLILTRHVEGTPFIEDLFANRIEYGSDTPWGGTQGRYIEDIDMILVKRWLADTRFHLEPSTGAILEATSLVAHRCSKHPVREWLNGLKWDGVARIDTWIRDYCKGKGEEPYLSEASRKFLVAMVKRIFEPGCQWDYVLILEGPQGQYKSSIARALATDKWFMDNLPDLKDKDSMLNLQGKWLIELGELADVKRADYNQVKAYLVRRTDTVRPHYGRLKADVPRQSVFIGTINEGQYLKDPTGNRRYWPVRVGRCDVDALKKVRDQLFAEAMHFYRRKNETLMMSPKASAQAKEAQDHRRIDDDNSEMREMLLEFMETNESGSFDFSRFKTRDLMTGVKAPWGPLAMKPYVMQTASQVLASMGFEKHKVMGQRFWSKRGSWKRAGQTKKGGLSRSAPMPLIAEMDFF